VRPPSAATAASSACSPARRSARRPSLTKRNAALGVRAFGLHSRHPPTSRGGPNNATVSRNVGCSILTMIRVSAEPGSPGIAPENLRGAQPRQVGRK